MIDTLMVKLMCVAVHAEEFIETGHYMDAESVKSLLSDPEIVAKRAELDAQALLPVKRSG